jgi:hypothetical protein
MIDHFDIEPSRLVHALFRSIGRSVAPLSLPLVGQLEAHYSHPLATVRVIMHTIDTPPHLYLSMCLFDISINLSG